MRHIILAMTLLMAFTGACLAVTPEDQLNKAMSAYVAGNNTEAAKELKIVAKQGSSVAQFWLSEIYSQGRGVPQDHHEALKWCELSAEQGDELAMHKMGYMYFYGKGVPQDYKEAFKWFERNAHWPLSQTFLGEMYAQGLYVDKDLKTAKEWFQKSCNNGSEIGCQNAQVLAEAGN